MDVYLVVLHRVLRATTKKVVNFFEEKRAPPDKFFKVRAWALSLPIFAILLHIVGFAFCPSPIE